MRKRLGDKVEMWRSVHNLQGHATYGPLIAAVTGINAGFTALGGYITQTEAVDVSRAGAATEAGSAKGVARGLLINTALMVDGILTAHAAATNDALTLAEVNKEASDLRNARDEELRAHVQYLLGKIPTPIPAALADLGLTTAMGTLLQSRYDTFYTLMTLPQDRVALESTFVELLRAQEVAVDRLLDLQLDKLMRQFMETNVELWEAYKAARVIRSSATVPEEEEDGGSGSGGSGGSGSGGSGSGI